MTGLSLSQREEGQEPKHFVSGENFLELIHIEAVKSATGHGRTGVTLYFKDNRGELYAAYTTARLIANGAASFIKGTMEYWGDDPNQP